MPFRSSSRIYPVSLLRYNPPNPKRNSQPNMAKILSVASNEVLRTTRQLLLEQAGFSVYSALTLAEVEEIGQTEKLDLALIGHGFGGPEKRKMARTVNQLFPGLPILEMCFHSPEIPGADFVLNDSPAELLKAIRLILNGRRVRGYTE
jgi:CheY-like chemotaxis protein